jgi:hypothetical protein
LAQEKRLRLSTLTDGMPFAVTRINNETEDPRIDVLGIFKDLADAQSCAELAERREHLKSGSEVLASVYDHRSFSGEILERKVDFSAGLSCPVRYLVRLVHGQNSLLHRDEELAQLAGKSLPKTFKTKYMTMKLEKGVSGTSECVDLPEKLVKDRSLRKERPSFDILRCKAGPGSKVWASMYEPSTTGWGDPDETPQIMFFASKAAANAHAKQRLKKRLAHLRNMAKEGCYGSDSDGTTDPTESKRKTVRDKWPFVPPAALFQGDFPDKRRSKIFRNGVWNIDHRHTAAVWGNGFYVGLIRNWHGGHLDGCGNPEMEEVVWTNEYQVHQKFQPDSVDTPVDSKAKKRPAACADTSSRAGGKKVKRG